MDILESVCQLISGEHEELQAPMDHCPNCWGYQEYQGKFKDVLTHENIDTNNLADKKG